MEATTDNILKAKSYMYEYKMRVETHKNDIGFIGRFFEKLFGTDFYSNLDIDMYTEYRMKWIDAYEILSKTHNNHIIYELK